MSEEKATYGNKPNYNDLQNSYRKIVHKYIDIFCAKEDVDFYGWVGDEIGGVAHINDFTFDFRDIKFSVDNHLPQGMIIDWYYHCVDYNMDKEETTWINLHAYSKGMRLNM